ncbi:hypothetical protein F5Y12DRAFT_780428 [Xylaria sp. FL1777]|nr:hypothetical protein F5Y12DRAFT_780428 [Xylaria sp. FL1777]
MWCMTASSSLSRTYATAVRCPVSCVLCPCLGLHAKHFDSFFVDAGLRRRAWLGTYTSVLKRYCTLLRMSTRDDTHQLSAFLTTPPPETMSWHLRNVPGFFFIESGQSSDQCNATFPNRVAKRKTAASCANHQPLGESNQGYVHTNAQALGHSFVPTRP